MNLFVPRFPSDMNLTSYNPDIGYYSKGFVNELKFHMECDYEFQNKDIKFENFLYWFGQNYPFLCIVVDSTK